MPPKKGVEAAKPQFESVPFGDDTTHVSDKRITAALPAGVAAAYEAGDIAAPTRALFRGEVEFSEGTSLLDVLRFGQQ